MTKRFPFLIAVAAALSCVMTVSAHAGGGTDDNETTPTPVSCGTEIMGSVDPATALANTARLHPDIYQKMMAPKPVPNPMLMKRNADDDVEWTFNVENQATNSYDQVTGTLKFTGKYVRIWVDTAVKNVNASTLLQLARALDSTTISASRNPKEGIIQNDIDVFGPMPPNVWMSDNMSEFLLTDIKDAVANADVLGFFSPVDQDPNNPASNHMNILYIDSKEGLQGGLTSLLSTVAHEFQHLLHYPRNPTSETMYNEGCSEDASILNGYMDRGNSQFMGNTNVDLFRWSNGDAQVTADYERAMTFIHYLQEQFGEQFLYQLVGERSTGMDRIDRALAKVGNNSNYRAALEGFAVANLLRTNDNPLYGYQTPIKSGGTPKMAKSYALPTYPADTSFSVERLASVYVAYTNTNKLSESIKLHLNGAQDYSAVAVLYQGSNIEVRHLGGNGDYTLGGVKPYDKIVLVLVNTAPSQQVINVTSQRVVLGVDDAASNATAGMALTTMPNPFVGSTILHFTTPESSPVTLKIFNSRGDQVGSLLDGDHFEAGAHDVVFNAGDLPDGYYVARLTIGEKTISQSLILLK